MEGLELCTVSIVQTPGLRRIMKTVFTAKNAVKAYNKMQEYVLEHSRLRIPALLSTECPHGHQALDSYLLPVNLNMGATFNTELIHSAYSVCGKQLREMGVDLALISLLDVVRDPRWGRSEECFFRRPISLLKNGRTGCKSSSR